MYLTVMLPDAKNPKVNLGPEGTFTFTATGGAGDHVYELKLDLFDKVNVEVILIVMVDVFLVQCALPFKLAYFIDCLAHIYSICSWVGKYSRL